MNHLPNRWSRAIRKAFGQEPPLSQQWSSLDEMQKVLSPFLDGDLNFTFYPTTGGDALREIWKMKLGWFNLRSGDHSHHYCQPSILYWEHFPASEQNSFFLMEGKHRFRRGAPELPGKFLMVSKASLWNGYQSAYNAPHNDMTVQEIRTVIENALHQQ